MKKNISLTISGGNVSLSVFLWVIILAFPVIARAQMTFTQTSDSDFQKGVFQNIVSSENNIIPQSVATGCGSWVNSTNLPAPLSGHKMVSANGKHIYLVGGGGSTGYSSAVHYAALQGNTLSAWNVCPSLPVSLSEATVLGGTNAVYVIGGRNGNQCFNSIHFAIANPDGSLGAWQTSPITLPVSLRGHSASWLNGMIFVAGGATGTEDSTVSNHVYRIKIKADLSIESVTPMAGLPAPRSHGEMVSNNGQLFFLGGKSSPGQPQDEIFTATPDNAGNFMGWNATGNLPVALSNFAAAVTNGSLFLLGGETETSLSNLVYHTNPATAQPWTWSASTNVLYEPIRDGSAVAGNGVLLYGGGINATGLPVNACKYAPLTLTGNYVAQSSFTSYPFYELGADRLIQTLTFTAYFNPSWANCQVSYRTATSNKIWSDWTPLTSTTPIPLNMIAQYLQYRVELTAQGLYKPTFCDMSMKTPGTPISGNLNAYSNFTPAAGPFWVTGDISFTSGTHTFQAGTTFIFAPGTGLSIGQAGITCSGTVADSVRFIHQGVETGKWDGISFDANSDNGVSSQLYYTVITGAGYGSNNANLYCTQTNEPLLVNCNLRLADGNGIHLSTANNNIQNCSIRGNSENGINLENSSPVVVNCSISRNGAAGVRQNANTASFETTTIVDNTYGIRFSTPNLSISSIPGNPVLTGNTFNGVAFEGGDITTVNKIWSALPYDYYILGNIRIVKSGSNVRLTLQPGVSLKFEPSVQLQVGASGNGGELHAIGTPDSLITFSSRTGLPGGWSGIWFQDANDNYSGTSVLKYCIIEKAVASNVLCESSAQPLMEKCIISGSQAIGLKLTSANIQIKNCTFSANATFGVYLDGATSVAVGNTTVNSCSFYGNGAYGLYNNTTNNINARYNFWGVDDSTTVTQKIFDKSDNSAKGTVYFSPFTSLPFLTTPETQTGGYVRYDNAAQHFMKNVNLTLKNFNDSVISTASTGSTGTYDFLPVASGCYKMNLQPSDPWGGVNSTDALMVLNHFSQTNPLTGLKLKAADVNASKSVNATDALFIMRRYSGVISSFPAGDYYTKADSIAINGSQITSDYRMIWFGDVNGSYVPPQKSNASSVVPEYEGSVEAISFSEFVVPIRINPASEIGAISLGIHYPQEYFTVLDAEIPGSNGSLTWSATDGLFRMAWCAQQPFQTWEDGVLVRLRFSAGNLSSIGGPVYLQVYQFSEFANPDAMVYPLMILTITVITTEGLSSNGPSGEKVSVFYHEASSSVLLIDQHIKSLSTEGHVIFDLSGRQYSTRKINGSGNVGDPFVFIAPRLNPGVYMLKINGRNVVGPGSGIYKFFITR